ncbi:MAG TPA: hypothetical protein VFS40_15360 [Gemmatimonadales bacterium]|nr:hypothetical protein [Gemmatimonadales bacterium]
MRVNSHRAAARGSLLAALTLLTLAACGRGDRPNAAAADSAGRDLQLAPAPGDGAALDDRGDAAGAATPEAGTTSAGATSAPAANAASGASAAPAARTLARGTRIPVKTARTLSSRTDKPGATLRATVTTAVKDAAGRTVIPAGAVVTLRAAALHESENKSDPGTLRLAVERIEVNGRSQALDASVGRVPFVLQGRKTNAGDVAKVGAGAGVGAVAGRVLGGSTKGAVIGGVIGGAVGAQRAVETKDRDVVLPAGTALTLTLGSSTTFAAR